MSGREHADPVKRTIPQEYGEHLAERRERVLGGGERLSFRAFWVGGFLSFFLAVGAPYGNMILRGSFMAMDFSTPGAIFLFLFLIGLLNCALKLARQPAVALGLAASSTAAWLVVYRPALGNLDFYSPGLMMATFLVLTTWLNLPVVLRGGSLALNRSELVLVYAMLLIVSALCTMGLAEQFLPIVTAMFYFATPENRWAEKLFPHLPEGVMVDDGTDSRLFYEGLSGPEEAIPYASWVEPLVWWGVFLLALYVMMVSVAVILRRQWMDRERLAYPIAQVGLAMIRSEHADRAVNGFFKRPVMWLGAALPLAQGSLRGLKFYEVPVPTTRLEWNLPFIGRQTLHLSVNFAVLGFSYFINANIAAGIWFFHLLSTAEKQVLILTGLQSSQKIGLGVSDYPFLGYQGVGALLAMVVVGLWVGREHYWRVLRKAVGLAPEVRDDDEILSYRGAVAGALGGTAVMTAWLSYMGTPMWVTLLFLLVAVLIFIGITRIVTEAGLAVVRGPMIAGDLVVQGVGSSLIGPAGVVNLSLAHVWAADIRVFVMGTASNALKMIEEMEPRNRRTVFWCMIAALFIGAAGSLWMIFHMAYLHGALNLNGWFFQGLPRYAYDAALRNIEPQGTYWPGVGFFGAGAAAMVTLMWLRHRLPWWPVHPIGLPIGATPMMNRLWFNVFVAWVVKLGVLRYGGATGYQKSQPFFLGLISGQVLCSGGWLVIDYFTGAVGNYLYEI